MAINCLGVSWTLVLWGFVGLRLDSAASLQSIIKGLPNPPRNLYTTSYEFDEILHFTAANSTGGLPTNYTVYLDCIAKCMDNEGPLYVPRILQDCESLKHVDGKSYQCDLRSANLFATYRATVCAINPLGNASASIKFHRPDPTSPSTIPAIPIQLVATEVKPGKVRITWKDPNKSYLDITYFRIEYREEGSNKNKTWAKDNEGSDTTVVIDHLNADTMYYFYVKKQFRASKLFSPFSAPAVVSLHTKSADPRDPPQALNCSKIKDDLNVTIVWVSWKAPPKKHRNGPLVTYSITYSIAGSKNKTIMVANASENSIKITIPRLFKRMEIYSVACNNHGCSGISNSCYVEGNSNPTITSKLLNGNKTAILVGVIVTAIILALIVILVIYCCFCRKKSTPRRLEITDLGVSTNHYHEMAHNGNKLSLNPIVTYPQQRPYIEMYDCPEDTEDEHDYDRPLV